MRPTVVLASASPRRHELLKQVVDEFLIDPADIDEESLTVADPFETAEQLALAKATSVAARHPGCIVIGCDTVVALQSGETWEQFAKPVSFEDAVRMLRELSGRTHIVVTGVSVVYENQAKTSHAFTRVTFSDLSEETIREYVATGEPMDKAGAYGAQGMAGGFVTMLDGDLDTVIGLPVKLVQELLEASW